MTDGEFCTHIHPASHSWCCRKEDFQKSENHKFISFSPLIWKVYRNMRFVWSGMASSDLQHFWTFCCETQSIRDMLEIVMQPHHIWVWLPLTKLGNCRYFSHLFSVTSTEKYRNRARLCPQWKHTHTHRVKALGNFPESQKANIHLAIFLSLNASLIL